MRFVKRENEIIGRIADDNSVGFVLPDFNEAIAMVIQKTNPLLLNSEQGFSGL
jgi:hypothetical protein